MRLIDADALIDKTDDRYSLHEIGRRERDDIVDALEYAPTIHPEPSEECERCMMEHMDSMEELETKLAMAESHWIPVTERLPNKEEKSYWVCLEGGGQCQCRWTNDVYGLGANEWSKWGWKKVDLPQYSKVVAYMPLPEPYKGVTDGRD